MDDFRSLYRHDLLRVAACTAATAIGTPLRTRTRWCTPPARATTTGGAGDLLELTLSGYSIEDLLMQDTLLEAVERRCSTSSRPRPT